MADDPQSDRMSVADFSAKIKQREPRLKDVPDDVLVRKVLERRPDLSSHIRTMEPRLPHQDFLTRVNARVGGQLEGINRTVGQGLKDLFTGKGFSGQPTPEADKRVFPWGHGAVGSIAGPLTLPQRMVGQQAASLAKDYRDPANLAGDAIVGYITGKAMDMDVGKLSQAAGEFAERKAARPPVNAPPELAPEMRLSPEQQTKYTEQLDKANRDYSKAVEEHGAKETEARRRWADKMFKAKQSVEKAQAVENKQAALERGSQEYVRMTQDNIRQVHDAVRGKLDADFGQFRAAMKDGGAEVNAPDIFNSVKAAEDEYLRGAPDSVAQFKQLTKELGLKEFVEDEAGGVSAAPTLSTVPFETAWTHYSAIGNRLASGNLPGNVYKALRSVQDSLGDALGDAAESQGQGDAFRSLQGRWSQYMRDWKDTSAVSTGGSPLAKSLAATDPGFVMQQIKGKAGDRMMQTLARYREYGAKPHLPAAARRMAADADAATIELGSLQGEKRTIEARKPTAKEKEIASTRVKDLSKGPYKYEASVPPELREVNRPRPEPPKPKKLGRMQRRLVRLPGYLGGAAISPLIGVWPWAGGHIGAEGAEALAERMIQPRPPQLPVPPELLPPE